MHENKSSLFAKSATAVGIASLLFLTGCASSTPAPNAADTAAPSVSATATATETAAAEIELDPIVTAGMTPEQLENYKKEVAKFKAMTPEEMEAYNEANNGPFSSRLVAAQTAPIGGTVRVSGGSYAPGNTIKVQGFQLMPMPSYDAANDMYHQVGEQIPLTSEVIATANEQGQFDIQLPVPAGIAPQQMDIIGQVDDGTATLVRTNAE